MSDLGVRANLDPSTWAGSFSCATCARARLPASEFSRKTLETKLLKGEPGRCKKCVENAADAERSASRADDAAGPLECSACGVSKPASAFSRTQARKESGRKCAACAEESERSERERTADARAEALRGARAASATAEATNSKDKLAVFAAEAALEASVVTGLRPQFLGRGGRGRGRSNPNSALGRGGRK